MEPGEDPPSMDALEAQADRAGLSLSVDPTVQDFVDEVVSALDPLFEDGSESRPTRDFRWVADSDSDQGDEDQLNAFVTRCAVQRRQEGPLAGLDIAVKDNIAVAGVPLTCGVSGLRENRPATDATAVDRLLDAGATVVGKTTMNELAMGGGAETFRFGRPRNPHDTDRHPGGSSAGSAIAVATGAADLALGSDTAASIRCPAAYCGVVGLRPSQGLVSHHGFVQFAKTLDAIGLLGRDVGTVALGLEAAVGYDPRDADTATCRRHDRVNGYVDAADLDDSPVENLEIGVPAEMQDATPPVQRAVDAALDQLADAGATLRPVSLPSLDLALAAWVAIACTEFRAYLAADGVNRWLDGGAIPAVQAVVRAHRDGDPEPNPTLQSMLLAAEHLDAGDNRAVYRLGRRARRTVAEKFANAFTAARVDVLAAPTMPAVAPRWDEDTDSSLFESVRNAAPCAVAGVPALSIPCGRDDEVGMPVGLQFIAPRFGERALLEAAAAWADVAPAASHPTPDPAD